MSSEPPFPPVALVPLAQRVSDLLRRRGEKVCVVETACGGLLSATLLSLPGASAIFAGSQTLYTLPSRVTLADWTPEHVRQYDGPTPAIVEGLCVSLRTRLTVDPFGESAAADEEAEAVPAASSSSAATGAAGPGGGPPLPPPPAPPPPSVGSRRIEDSSRLWALGESGTAGPGRSGEGRNRTPGYVALAVVGPRGQSRGREEMFNSADRVENMVAFARAGLGLLLGMLEEAEGREGKKGSVM